MTIVEALPNKIGKYLIWKKSGAKFLVLFSSTSGYIILTTYNDIVTDLAFAINCWE